MPHKRGNLPAQKRSILMALRIEYLRKAALLRETAKRLPAWLRTREKMLELADQYEAMADKVAQLAQ